MSGFNVLGMTVEPAIVSLFILAFIVGMYVPFQYGVERLRGFGRTALSKLPYKPPEEPAPNGTPKAGELRDARGNPRIRKS